MLLSLPTWFIHIATVGEWLVAMFLFWQYGRLIQNRKLQFFALSMTPHLCAGIFILLFHSSNDTHVLYLTVASFLTFTGSLLLLTAALTLLLNQYWRWSGLVIGSGLIWILMQWSLFGENSALFLRAANLYHISFLLVLLAVYRRQPTLFSPLIISGFWLLLVFVAVTLLSTQIAVTQQGLPSLSHHDLLHGLSESVLSVSNLLIAIGVSQRIAYWRSNAI
ncbi:hypothetical protein CKO12_01195 [Chromatium okenii]|uniref:DUF2499 domain-containing protein n=1 Tax=Chromatium okenii TaxID=61644 RepID=UPI001906B240|nr:DUF2499 domain-containing protein [Chromatium okenii]MBK1640514.1 hypothetical protein [Chromatium okenii]